MSNNKDLEEILSKKDYDEVNKAIKFRLKQQDQIAKKFYDMCKFITDKYTEESSTLFKIFLKILSAVQYTNPHFAIKSSGPFFWKFRKEINSDDVTWVFDYNFAKQMEDWKEIAGKFPTIIDNKLNSITESVRDRIKEIAKDTDPDKGSKLCKTFLKWYSIYSILDKDLLILKELFKELDQ